MAVWSSSVLFVAIVLLLLLAIMLHQQNVLAGERTAELCKGIVGSIPNKSKPSRRFRVQNKEDEMFCIAKQELADGAFLEDMQPRKVTGKECKKYLFVGKTTRTTTSSTTAEKEIVTKVEGMETTNEVACSTTTVPKVYQWTPSKPIDTKGRGLFLDGKLSNDWKQIKFTFFQAEKQPLFTFEATKANDKFELDLVPGTDSDKKKHFSPALADIVKEEDGSFELYVELDDKSVRIRMLDGKFDEKLALDEDHPKIVSIEKQANFDGQLKHHTTLLTTEEGKILKLTEPIDRGNSLIITGKLFSNAKRMQFKMIDFKSFEENITVEEAAYCFVQETNQKMCTILLDIDVNLEKNIAAVNRQANIPSTKNKNIWQHGSSDKKTHFLKEQQFSLNINGVDCNDTDDLKPTPAFMIDQIEGMDPVIRDPVNMIWVMIDDGVLFDELKVENTTKNEDEEMMDCPKLKVKP